MRRLAYLPNLLSTVRIMLAPAMLGAAYSNSKPGFAVLLGAALVSDVLDGACARAWQATSELGGRLDRWGDGLTMVGGAIGVFFLWPVAVEREWAYALAALAGYVLIGAQRLVDPADGTAVTRWWGRVAAWAVPLSLIAWLAFHNPWAFRAASLLHLLLGASRVLGAWVRHKRRRPEATRAEQPFSQPAA